MDQSYVLKESFFLPTLMTGETSYQKLSFSKMKIKKGKISQFSLYILDRRHLSAFILMSVSLQDIIYPISKLQNKTCSFQDF